MSDLERGSEKALVAALSLVRQEMDRPDSPWIPGALAKPILAQIKAAGGGLRGIVSEFRKGILNGQESDMMCAVICYPLQSYLAFLGIKTEIVEADFGTTNHVWLALPDGRIIDPTADQFSGPLLKLPKIYIGSLPEIYKKWMSKIKL